MAAVAVLFWSAQIYAAEPSITIQGSQPTSNYDDYVDRVGSSILSDAALAAESPGSGTTHYLDLQQPLSKIPGFSDLPMADRTLIRGAKRTYDLFRALGGPTSGGGVVVAEAYQGRYYLGLDGEGGRWVTTPQDALTFLAQQLVETTLYLRPSRGGGTSCPFDFRCLLRATYTGDVETIAYMPRGTTVTLLMTGEGFEQNGGPPVLLAPDGFIVHELNFIDSENLSARVSLREDAPLGLNVLAIFNEGLAFRSRERYGIFIVAGLEELNGLIVDPGESDSGSSESSDDGVPKSSDGIPGVAGSGEVELLVDDHSDQKASASELLALTPGRFEQEGDIDLFKIVIDVPGNLTVSSAGPTDVSAVLENTEGTVVVADDDSGLRYNFAIETPVAVGVYYLRVTHCCGGRGAYRITRQFQSN